MTESRSDQPSRAMEPSQWDALLRTAAREFAEAGYPHASLNRIIKSCGLSKSSFYYFVGSKAHLFDAVLAEFGPALLEQLDVPAVDDLGPNFWSAITGIVDRLLNAAGQDEIYLLLGRMWYLPGAPTSGASTLQRHLSTVDRWLAQALRAGRRAGAVRDDLPLELQARLLTATVRVFDEWSVQHRGAEDIPARELAHAQLGAVRRLLEAP
ncbi:TetR/AcrR family transcriptional regulator [Ornithinimicrobium faecis]|uniref:TetR/AcrR family transcriptional regulator n=1 Tax=Ornithinimicrobium faecis TaxID=2934158 RepID=UPI0021198D98|nr:TetR/AcrR family transcriptional regulator [Ornithinimicrobium sp. HY1745]